MSWLLGSWKGQGEWNSNGLEDDGIPSAAKSIISRTTAANQSAFFEAALVWISIILLYVVS